MSVKILAKVNNWTLLLLILKPAWMAQSTYYKLDSLPKLPCLPWLQIHIFGNLSL